MTAKERIGYGVLAVLVGGSLRLITPVSAQTPACVPVPIHTLAFGSPGQSIVPSNEDKTTNLVPAGKIWVLKAGSIGQGADPGTALEYRLQIDHQWPDQSYWYAAVAITPTPQRGTPVIALPGGSLTILEEGERLSARSNSMPNGGTMYVMALGWELPAACLAAVLGLH